MAESRGGNEDRALKSAYNDVWENGTSYITAQKFRDVLTGHEIKLKKKEQNIAGLQLADLLAAPSKLAVLLENNRQLAYPPSSFTMELNRHMQAKFNRYARVLL